MCRHDWEEVYDASFASALGFSCSVHHFIKQSRTIIQLSNFRLSNMSVLDGGKYKKHLKEQNIFGEKEMFR